MTDVLTRLEAVLLERKDADADTSYVASLYAAGLEKILKKIGEEAAETLIAAAQGQRTQIVYELADLWFHTLVLLAQQDIPVANLLTELERRMGTSGHVEKAHRGSP